MAQFREDKIWERQATATVMVPQTRERQEVIAAANTTVFSKPDIEISGGSDKRTKNCKQLF